jgi:hypothetical protein
MGITLRCAEQLGVPQTLHLATDVHGLQESQTNPKAHEQVFFLPDRIKGLPYPNIWSSVKRFVDYTKNSICIHMYSRICCGSICVKVGIIQQRLVKVSGIELRQYTRMWSGLWDTWKSPCTGLSILDFIMDQNGWKSEFPNIVWNLEYLISTTSMKRSNGYTENSIYGLMWTGIYYGLICLEVWIAQQFLAEASNINFQQSLWNILYDTWKSPFTTVLKPGFITDPCGWNSNYRIF